MVQSPKHERFGSVSQGVRAAARRIGTLRAAVTLGGFLGLLVLVGIWYAGVRRHEGTPLQDAIGVMILAALPVLGLSSFAAAALVRRYRSVVQQRTRQQLAALPAEERAAAV